MGGEGREALGEEKQGKGIGGGKEWHRNTHTDKIEGLLNQASFEREQRQHLTEDTCWNGN